MSTIAGQTTVKYYVKRQNVTFFATAKIYKDSFCI